MAGLKHSERPFRIWDENAKRDIPHRCYTTWQRAVERALAILVWMKVGNSYTIYDSRSSKAKIMWKRTVEGLKEYRE